MTLFHGEKPIFPDVALLFERSPVVGVPEDETASSSTLLRRHIIHAWHETPLYSQRNRPKCCTAEVIVRQA